MPSSFSTGFLRFPFSSGSSVSTPVLTLSMVNGRSSSWLNVSLFSPKISLKRLSSSLNSNRFGVSSSSIVSSPPKYLSKKFLLFLCLYVFECFQFYNY